MDPAEWNALAGEQPFVRHEFLSALIDSGCASGRTGWLPQILLVRRNGALVGAMPMFLKSHSYGEYVFDWAWADAHERHGFAYYPKLLAAIPFTPVQGTRLLAPSDEERLILLEAARSVAKSLSSFHVLFPVAAEAELLRKAGMMIRHTVQFHWHNDGYADFESFLARMSHRRRKNIRQERRKARESGISFEWRTGNRIERGDWETFFRCYRRTYAAHGSSPYLTLDFFLRVGNELPDSIALLLAKRDGATIATALFFRDSTSLYGRYWGALAPVPYLHFECCYYQAIEFAIEHGLRTFEGGAQGEHKLFRGLLPVETLSAHWLSQPQFARAVADFLHRETRGIGRYVDELCDHSPFKRE